MTDTNSGFSGLAQTDENDLRAFLRRVRDGRTASFENRRGGDENTFSVAAAPTVTVFARETSDATVELGARIDETSAYDSSDAADLSVVSPGTDALAASLARALNDTFDVQATPDAFTRRTGSDESSEFVAVLHLPSDNLV